MSCDLFAIRECLDGGVPAVVATCAPDGTPNITYVSQVHLVDAGHVALSFQFFNKTRQNVLVNPQAVAYVINPESGARYRLHLHYLRTESEGPLFESMKARLAGIASHSGMSEVFRLRGSDVYRVEAIEPVGGAPARPERYKRLLPRVRETGERLARADTMAALFETLLEALGTRFDIRHAMVLLCDRERSRLFLVASRGYATSGVGSEIPYGAGVIGVAAQQRVPIRINYSAAEYAYGRAVRDSALARGLADPLETAIPFPGLAEPGSQMAVPILLGEDALGLVYVESEDEGRFNHDDEDALVCLAGTLGWAIRALEDDAETDDAPGAQSSRPEPDGAPPLLVRRYARDNSVFLDEDYLIKGVAGAILWRLLQTYTREGRVDFSNRELRRDPAIGLPDVTDNLEARLILLAKRLAERGGALRLEKTGRGRLRLHVGRPVVLCESP
ncbi:GAF domain-containing protein [Vulcaniibacterium thermophilum]|uniref:GAF domain-containing protein n=1 Tax=Vulcaniibacterium thermophilum TaxID=1169913 RepID=A0A918YVF0_9GAMM|nr:GAF domain-containing protein [Vulcaniibacterium thermophilum]GHE25891.1 hypothetical protein GCM10007167_03600 [Vulcaniibacterium thermophilum]